MSPLTQRARNLTPPEIARRYRVATAKVISWIKRGELPALNLSSGSQRPRYSISPEALEQFERGRQVVPAAEPSRRARRKRQRSTKLYV